MRLRTLASGCIAALILSTAGAGTASAATEFGDSCVGDAPAPGEYTLTTLAAPSAALPLTAPSGGVITKVKVNNGAEAPFSIPTTVKVLRSTGGNFFTVIAQQTVSAAPGVSTADTRLPVQTGDRLGLHGEPFSYEGSPVPGISLYCDGVEGSLGAATGDVPVGANAEFPPATEARVPLAAVIEPDADGDGYGDETQDKCPQSAASHDQCPVVILDSFALPKKSSVVVIVNTDIAAPVTVSASVKLPNEKKKAKASATAKLKKVSHNVTPGKLRYFTLKYPASLKGALAELAKGKKLKLKITASATNAAGQVSKDKTTLKLKGKA